MKPQKKYLKKILPQQCRVTLAFLHVWFTSIFLFSGGCQLRSTLVQKPGSQPEGFLIQQNPGHESKRIYWLQGSQNSGQDLCLCKSSVEIIGNSLKSPKCQEATTTCVDFSLFRLKFDEQSDFRHILALRNADLTAIDKKISYLKEGIAELEEELNVAKNTSNTGENKQPTSTGLANESELREILKKSKLQLDVHKSAKSTAQSELDFVMENETVISKASKQVTDLLMEEGRNFNLGPWSNSGSNNDILSFVSRMVFEANTRAYAAQQTPPVDLAQMPLQEAFKKYTIEFNLPKFNFHPNQNFLLPNKSVVGPYVEGFSTTEFRKDTNNYPESLKTDLMARRACLLSRPHKTDNGKTDNGKTHSDKQTAELVSPLATVDNLSGDIATAMLWDKNQQTLVIQCGFVTHVGFSDKTYSNAAGNEKEGKKSVYKINLQSIGLSATALHGQEMSVFTLGDLFRLIPETRIIYSAKK